MHLFAAVVWHYWIAVVLVISALMFVVVTVFGYLNKVSRPRYPRQ